MLTPEEIVSQKFLVSIRGYDRDEVHTFLRTLAEQVSDLHQRLAAAVADAEAIEKAAARAAKDAAREAERALKAERSRADQAEAALKATPKKPSEDDAAAGFAAIGLQTQRILEAAAEAADGMRQEAKREIEAEIRKARRQADKLVAEGERLKEQMERGTVDLVRKREEVTSSLRAVAKGLEQNLRDLTLAEAEAPAPAPAPPGTMREALQDVAATAAAAAASAGGPPLPTATATAPQVPAEPTEPVVEVEMDPRTAALSVLHPKVVRKLKRGLQDVQNVALERLRGLAADAEPAAIMPHEDEFASVGQGAVEFLEQAYWAGSQGGVELASLGTVKLTVPSDLAAQFQADVVRHVNGALASTLRIGASAREPAPALADRIGAVFSELKVSAADEIAALHLVRAYEAGMHDAWSKAGVKARRWVLGRELRCPEGRCRHNDQSGELALTEAFPSGHLHPPVHPGCTCTTQPVTEATS